MRLFAAAALSAAVAAPALAAAPEPQKPVDPSRYTGRYYEIARFANANQRDCHAPTYDWSRTPKGDLTIASNTLLIDDRAKGECSGAEGLVKENIKNSGDLRKAK